MALDLEAISLAQSFSQNRIISDFSYHFKEGSYTSIIGANGSGKSTLLKILSGFLSPEEGEIRASVNEQRVSAESLPFHVSVCSPFLQLEEELQLKELFDFHFSLRNPLNKISQKEFFELCFLGEHIEKQVKSLSSGMKQRLKLTLAFTTYSDLLLLDEPCSNLDSKGKNLYKKLIDEFCENRTLIVASNSEESEIEMCTESIQL